MRQNGRVSWRHDADKGKMLFFDPFNRLVLEIQCLGEAVTIINHRRRLFWQGEFRELSQRMWGLDLALAELREILEKGRIPSAISTRPDIRVDIARHSGTIKSTRIASAGVFLQLQILKRERLPGTIVFVSRSAVMTIADLTEVLARD